MKITYKDAKDYLEGKLLEKQFRLKVKYRRNNLKEKKYSLDRSALKNYSQNSTI